MKLNLYCLLTFLLLTSSCNKMLDLDPLSDVTPEAYFNTENDLATFTINQYKFPTHSGSSAGNFVLDNHTDNQVTTVHDVRWIPGQWRVPEFITEYDWTAIREINYFLEKTLPKWQEKKIQGSETNIQHYIGEAYFLRAYAYFDKLKKYGDNPIVKRTFSNDPEQLRAYAVRKPQNEVARSILADLDSAISLLQISPPGGKNRISQLAAQLFKSRVALYEGSWLIYHRNTAFVPGGPNWPGDATNPSFNISLDTEIDYFLSEAMKSSSIVADQVALVNNTKDNGQNSSDNPYFNMFSAVDLENFSEVLLWRAYDANLKIAHSVPASISTGGSNTGFTRAYVDNFLMANGLPIYASQSTYAGDSTIANVKKNRDNRLQLFMKAPGDLRISNIKDANGNAILFGYPPITNVPESRAVTGYELKKGLNYNNEEIRGGMGRTGSIVFRAAEAYLNYMEASYLKNKSLDAKASAYWEKIRSRAGVSPDYDITIQHTQIAEESKNDLAAYSAGQLLEDRTLYNIRRERRSEFIAEGFRYDDLRRWRSLDQLANSPYIVEGFNLWDKAFENYKNASGGSILIQPGQTGTANVSLKTESKYLRPYRINIGATNLIKDGYKWISAHYLSPIPAPEFVSSSVNGDISQSTVYQNPGWSTRANSPAE